MKPGAFTRSPEDYAQSRGFPAEAVPGIRQSLQALLPEGAHILDLGAGTGRLAHLALVSGFKVTALDLSRSMLSYLREHRPANGPPLSLVQADVASLPWPRASFEAALSVHVLHLVPDWRAALCEVWRVLRPGGTFLLGYTGHPEEDPISRIYARWRDIAAERGYGPGRKTLYDGEIDGWFWSRGVNPIETTAAMWTNTRTPNEALITIRDRLYPFFCPIPDDVYPALMAELETWVSRTIPDLNANVETRVSFEWRAYRVPVSDAAI